MTKKPIFYPTEPVVLEQGTVCCIYEPRGEHGLEGFMLDDLYPFTRYRGLIRDNEWSNYLKTNTPPYETEYYRIYNDSPDLEYSICKATLFNKYFKKVDNKKEEKEV